jgi:glycosyltransferase involved in cell wall biosynthesis
MKAPLISVIIPVYNGVKTIRKCFESLVSQNNKCFEVIIKDAVSVDGTLEIINEYINTYSYFRCFSIPDGGIYDAMNKSVSEANGNYFYFLGCDDFLVNEFVMSSLEKSIHNNPPAHLIYGDVLSKTLCRKTGGRYGGVFDEVRILRQNICHQAILYRRDLFKTSGYDTKFKYYADYAFNLNCILDASIVKIYVSLVIANFSEGGLSGTTLNDPVFQKDFPWIISQLAKTNFYSYKRKFRFLLEFFHRVNKSHGLKTSFRISQNDFNSFRRYSYPAFIICLTRYFFGLYFLKKKNSL